ncbi:MAG: hypothetical protein NTY36_16415 [Deltaproteobacteria bacterium]|nr:hypothetical protein [Deltaproteobacteria bacterium]
MNKKDIEIFRKAFAPKPIRLEQPPWSEEDLSQAYFRNQALTMRKIESRPGAIFSNAIEALDLSVALFKDTIEALLTSIDTFRHKSQEGDFDFRVNRFEQERYQLAVRRNLFSASAAAMALVHHTLTVQKKLKIAGYQERIDQDFRYQTDHLLIQGLRNCVLKARLLPADWQTTITYGEGNETRFFLRKSVLLSYRRWPGTVKKYINELDYGVNLEELFLAYRDRVVAFHAWYRDAIELTGGWALKEFREYQRIIKGIGWKSSYQILLHIARSKKIDPFEYLNKFLSPDKIKYVKSTKDLKQQVDRIIEVLDEYKACDSSLRSEVYQLFGLPPSPPPRS